MKTTLLVAGALAAALCAGQALAKHHAAAGAAVAGPKQPIPYAQLDAYLKASPKQRANKDWWSGAAATGAEADTSARSSSSAAPPLPATPPVNTPPASEPAAPPTAATPGAPVNPPPK